MSEIITIKNVRAYTDIDRDALDYQFEKHQEISKYEGNRQYSKGFREARKMLADAPAVDVAPVVRGRWKGAGMGDYYCSLCQEEISGNAFHYCPNCGAKMRKENEG